MNVFEKILEEIDNHVIEFESFGMCDDYISVGWVKEIIRSHMNHSGDDTEMGGWIPVEERLPNKNGVYNVTRLVDDTFISDSAYFDGQDTWHNDNRVNHTRPYLTDIVAWQNLPTRYIPPVISKRAQDLHDREKFFEE